MEKRKLIPEIPQILNIFSTTLVVVVMSLCVFQLTVEAATNVFSQSSTPIEDSGTTNAVVYQVGDFDNDGDIDILTQDGGVGTSITFWENNENGSFTNAGTGRFPSSLTNLNIAITLSKVSDFDNDGDLDIYCRASGASNDLYYQNDGSGSFTNAALPVPDSGTTNAVVYQVGDFDNDGDIDILTQDGGVGTSITFWENNGSGSFTNAGTGRFPSTLTNLNIAITLSKVGDFDNDGDLDIYCRASGASNDLYYQNDGSGSFTNAALPVPDSGTTNAVVYQVGDFDNDGDIDILTQDGGVGTSITLWENNGSGSFANTETGRFTSSLTNLNIAITLSKVADFDHDGDLDIYSRASGASNDFYNNNNNIPPRVISVIPTSNTVNAGISDNITLTLMNSSLVSKGTGMISIKVDNGDGNYFNDEVFESFPVADSRVSLTGDSSASTVTINPSGTFAPNVTYYLVIPPTAFLDTEGKGFVTLVGNRFHPGIPDPAIKQAGNSLHGVADRTILSFSAASEAGDKTTLYYVTGVPGEPASGDSLIKIVTDGTLAGTTKEVLLDNNSIQQPNALAIDLEHNRVFVGDSYLGNRGIYSVNLTTGAPTRICSIPGVTTALVADNVAQKLYFTTGESGQPASGDSLYSINMDGTDLKIIFDNDTIYQPNAMTLDVANDRAFVADSYLGHRAIYEVNLTTSEMDKVVDVTNVITDLYADPVNEKLYFVTGVSGQPANGDSLMCVDMDGLNMTTILNNNNIWQPNSFALDISSNKAYVADSYLGNRGIFAVDLITGTPTRISTETNVITKMEITDIIPPIVSTNTISPSNITSSGMDLSWTAARDLVTAQGSLQYKIVYSLSDDINDLSSIETNGTTAVDWTVNLTNKSITDLQADTDYYFNVIVKDTSGNKAIYNAILEHTLEETSPVNSVTVTPNAATVQQGNTQQLAAVVDVVGSVAQTVTWTSNGDTQGVTVDANGLVRVASDATLGEYIITATSTADISKFGTSTISVNTAALLPGAPTNVITTRGNERVIVKFTAPASDGGSPITGYKIKVYEGETEIKTVDAARSPATVTGLTNGTTYTFKVSAVNAVGEGPDSEASSSVTPATIPGTPTNLVASGGNGQAVITFDPPVNNGGAEVTQYIIVAEPGGKTVTGTGSPITITGLTNGKTYKFTVKAKNAAGTSVPAYSNSVAVGID